MSWVNTTYLHAVNHMFNQATCVNIPFSGFDHIYTRFVFFALFIHHISIFQSNLYLGVCGFLKYKHEQTGLHFHSVYVTHLGC